MTAAETQQQYWDISDLQGLWPLQFMISLQGTLLYSVIAHIFPFKNKPLYPEVPRTLELSIIFSSFKCF